MKRVTHVWTILNKDGCLLIPILWNWASLSFEWPLIFTNTGPAVSWMHSRVHGHWLFSHSPFPRRDSWRTNPCQRLRILINRFNLKVVNLTGTSELPSGAPVFWVEAESMFRRSPYRPSTQARTMDRSERSPLITTWDSSFPCADARSGTQNSLGTRLLRPWTPKRCQIHSCCIGLLILSKALCTENQSRKCIQF
jgi:hypothetical protein